MKFIIAFFISTLFMANNFALSGPLDSLERKLDKLFGKEIESGADVKAAKKKKYFKDLQTKKLANHVTVREVLWIN